MYTLLVKTHVTLALLSFISFIIRAWWGFSHSALVENKFALVIHQILTVFMLISAGTLCIMLDQFPLVNGWLTEKLSLFIVYAFSTMLLFQLTLKRRIRVLLMIVTCGIWFTIFTIGKAHSPLLFG
ncbi:SirB2 family protein [Vibrio maritimus]|uniref:SirB2 family protein n=1 Tax=Vibrio maritimus TaxID=990268 RepID=UPI0040688B96